MAAAGALAAQGHAAASPQDVVGVAAIVRGAPPIHQLLAASAGEPVILLHYFALGPACRRTDASVRVVTPPAHGALSVEAGEERPFADGAPLFPASDPRSACADRLAPTEDAVYTPAPGYSGHDAVVVEITEGGVTATDTVEIDVLSPVSTGPSWSPSRGRR